MHWGGVMPWHLGGPEHFMPHEAVLIEAYDEALMKAGTAGEGKHGR
jgi:hypothetical protein